MMSFAIAAAAWAALACWQVCAAALSWSDHDPRRAWACITAAAASVIAAGLNVAFLGALA